MDGWKKWALRAGGTALAAAILGYLLLFFLSYRAADIFNLVVEHRQLFPGTVTVESLKATPWGKVEFTNLRWVSPEGVLLADIPEGEFRVKPLDVLTRHLGTRSVTYARLRGAYLHLIFDDQMQLTGFKREKQDQEEHEKKRGPGLSIVGLKSERPFVCKVDFEGGTIEAEAPGSRATAARRHFTIGHAHLRADINTRGKLHLNLAAGQFSGTVAAKAFYLQGNIDLQPEMPTYDLYLSLKECDMNSLDVGMKLDDPASISGRLTGELPRPVFDGEISFEKLHMPALDFRQVRGFCHYENGVFRAKNVTANIFGGKVEARGFFDIDEKAWGLLLHGEGLKSSRALRDRSFRCRVVLDLHMYESRAKQKKETFGRFYSGEGSYHMIPFKGLSGSFEQQGKRLIFREAVIRLTAGDVKTDIFSLDKGRLEMAPIYLHGEGAPWRLY